MNIPEIKSRIKATIDQFYTFPNRDYIKQSQLHYIGGVLQTALHLLDVDDYYDIKMYVYTRYGYDPGGCTDGQIGMEDMRL